MSTTAGPERQTVPPAVVSQNEGMPAARSSHRSGRPARLLSAVFQPIGDEGRAALVERRIAEAITGGVLHAGERLPSEQDLAQINAWLDR